MPSYADAIEWIARNDNPGDNEGPGEIAEYLTVALIADLWGKTTEQVARDVFNHRDVFYQRYPWMEIGS